jgi:ubiquinone biosynthesis protein
MVKPEWIPTPLVPPAERQPILILPAPEPSRLPGLSVMMRVARWAMAALWLRVSGRGNPAAYGRLFRELLEDLGGLWIKLGQLLSLRVDILPYEFARELLQLQVKAVGFPPRDAIAILESDLGLPIDQVFSEFDETPLAAASMGQVHCARLKSSGVRVAVKVQRPYLPRTFTHQLKVIRRFARMLQIVGFRPHMRWDDAIWELQQMMHEEMDCRYEGGSTRRMRRTLKPHGIYAPKVFHASERVLITEFVDGVLMADYIQMLRRDPERLAAWLNENDIDPRTIGRNLTLSILRQIIEDNLYHGDLHPGNIMLLRHNRVALIDFGSCSFTELGYLELFRLSIQALAQRDYAKAADISLMLSGRLPRVDLDEIRDQFIRAMIEWANRAAIRELPYHEKSVAALYNVLIRIMYDHHCTMEWTLLRIRRAQETLDASLMHLFPDADYSKISADYFREADKRAMDRTNPAQAARGALSGLAGVLDATGQLDEFTLLQGGIIRRNARVFETATNKVEDLLSTAVGQLAALALFAGALAGVILLAQHRPDLLPLVDPTDLARLASAAPGFDWQIWGAVAAAGAAVCTALLRLRRRLRRSDVSGGARVASI